MTNYKEQFKSGNVVLPAALLFNFKEIFESVEDFLVWQFFFLQNTSQLEEIAPSQIAEATGKTLSDINQSISRLQSQGLLEFKTIELSGEIEMIFDASPVLEKLDMILSNEPLQDRPKLPDNPTESLKQLISDLEQELGPIFNGILLEEVTKLVYDDGVSPELIRAATREAVFNNKRNWKYIQGILWRWRKEGITTVSQVNAQNAEWQAAKNTPQVEVSSDFLSAMNLWKDE